MNQNLNWMTKSQSDTINHVIRIENNNDIDEDKDEGPSYHQVLQPQDKLLHPGKGILWLYKSALCRAGVSDTNVNK